MLNLTVLGRDAAFEKTWVSELEAIMEGMVDAEIGISAGGGGLGSILLVDAGIDKVEHLLKTVDRREKTVYLVVGENSAAPQAWVDGLVDDVLVYPFRALEVVSKLKLFQQFRLWEEVNQLNASFSTLIERLQEDLKLAERMQKARLPLRFPEIKGLRAASRYLAGMRAGGDHFDLAESKDRNLLSLVLSDSSSYGLSSSLLSILMRVTVKLSLDDARSCENTVKKIQDELLLTLGEKDRLSLFYGTISRKDYGLRYLNLGSSCAFYARPKERFEELPAQGGALTRSSGLLTVSEQLITLHPDGRLALISDGFSEALGGNVKVRELLDEFRERDAADALNELVFRVKSKLESEDDMPAQDCSAVLLDLDSRLPRSLPV